MGGSDILHLWQEAAQKAEQQVATLKRDYGRIMRRQMAEKAEMEQHIRDTVCPLHKLHTSLQPYSIH